MCAFVRESEGGGGGGGGGGVGERGVGEEDKCLSVPVITVCWFSVSSFGALAKTIPPCTG